MKIGIYPGTFDPITNGHIDIVKRGSQLFDKLFVVLPINAEKKPLFSLEERMNLAREALKDVPNCEVVSTNLLTVEFAKKVGAVAMLRGLRMVSDFEYELQMATLNKSMEKSVETIFIMSSHQYSFLSSSIIKEIASYQRDVSKFVPEVVSTALKEKFKSR